MCHQFFVPSVVPLQGGSLCAVHTFVEGGANVRVVDDGGRGAMYHAAQVGAL